MDLEHRDGPAPEHDPRDAAFMERLIAGMGAHVFVGEFHRENGYRELYTGPGAEDLLGGAPPADIDPGEAWSERVHPDDLPSYIEAMSRSQRLIEPIEIEYRLVGFDGVTRWIRERSRPRRQDPDTVVIDGIALDVSDWRRVSDELAATQDHLDRVVGAISEFLWTIEYTADGEQLPVFTGPNRHRFLGAPAESRVGRREWEQAIHPEDRERVVAARAERAHGKSIELEYRLIGRDGVERWVFERGYPRRVQDGRLLVDGIAFDITDRKRIEADLVEALDKLELARADAERRSRIDPLTGVDNRGAFAELLERAVSGSRAGDGTTPGVILVDLDHFKRINDTYGHLPGDAVLVESARRLRMCLDPASRLARWGGEEFAILIPDAGGDEALRRAGEALRAVLSARPFDVAGEAITITGSVGAALSGDGAADADALVSHADRALYTAKRRGRNQVCVFSGDAASRLVIDEPEVLSIAHALAIAVSVRDHTSTARPERVADLAQRVAVELSLPLLVAVRCRIAGWLLDVGKLTYPDQLVEGTVHDAADETALRNHAVIGEQLVRCISGLEHAAPAVRHHHEWWDGSGFPDGLAGTSIPIEARVVAACDAYVEALGDADAHGEDGAGALAGIRALAGTRLDPAVVVALASVLGIEHEESDRRLAAGES